MNRRVRFACALLLCGAASVVALPTTHAQTTWQNAGTGDFLNPANWSNGVPTVGTAGIIDQGTAQANSAVQLSFGNLTLGNATGSNGSLVIDGSDLKPRQVEVGKFGTGTLTINSGYLDGTGSGQSIFVGGRDDVGGSTGIGVMNVNGGYVKSDDDIQFGRNGRGTLNFTGGVMFANYTVIGKYGTGIWNQSGGVYSQITGDFEIGDGGRPDQSGVPGPSEGFMTFTGGVIQVADRFAMGNRVGSSDIRISGGALSITGGNIADNSLYVGRGTQWEGEPDNIGGTQRLRITGDDAIIAVAADLQFDPANVFQSATLVAEITGSTHTPILVGRDAVIGNGILEVELNGYTPQSGDSWTLIRAGVDLTETVAAIDAMVVAEGPLDINGDGQFNSDDKLTHVLPNSAGSVMGQFKSFVTTAAPLASGLEWQLDYSDASAVVLRVIGESGGLTGDYNNDGMVNLADYTVWRDNLGASITLPGEAPGVTPGQVTAEDYTEWKNAFGNSSLTGGLTSSPTTVPEPTSIATVVFGMALAGAMTLRGRATRP
jgi:T5SS/PEP-CTERM-associated repeat protein